MSINVIVQSGNMGSNLSTRYTPNGKAISDFSLATKTGYGENEKTTWVTCKCFGERWEKLAQYIGKGSKVTVSGAFTLEEWEYEGKKHSKPVILVNDIELPAKSQSNQGAQNNTGGHQNRPQGNQGANQNSQAPAQNKPPMAEPDFDFDDDIPF